MKIIGVVLVLVGLVAGLFLPLAPAPVKDELRGLLHSSRERFVEGITLGKVAQTWVEKTIAAGQDQVVLYTNTTGRDVYANLGVMETVANEAGVSTASSTYNFALVATTTTEVPNTHDGQAVAIGSGTLIAATVPTSTTATTTNSLIALRAGGQGIVKIANGSSLIAYINRTGVITNCGGACENATSSSRGFNVKVRALIHFYDTVL